MVNRLGHPDLTIQGDASHLEAVVVMVHMQHTVRDYADWKAMFDADPLDRKGSGVTAYRICRPVDDAGLVMIDLDFEGREQAEQFLVRLRELWRGPAAGTIQNVDGWVVEVAESGTL
jgi:hypothetical protein